MNETILTQIDSALDEYQRSNLTTDVLETSREDMKRIYTRLGSTLDRLAPRGSFHRTHFERSAHGTTIRDRCKSLVGLLRALRTDYEKGYLKTVEELVHADMFSNFLDMAGYLLDQKFKDAAAVIAGSALEQHLRELCRKHGIDVKNTDGKSKKAEMLNQELRAKDVYNLLEQKTVTSWLDLRNSAAHGHFQEYDHKHVKDLISGVRTFIGRYPA